MPTREKCRPWLRAWACFRPRAKHDSVTWPKNAVQHGSCSCNKSLCRGSESAPAMATAICEEATSRPRPEGSATAARLSILLESLPHSIDDASEESFRQQPGSEQLNETDLFMASLLSDVKAQARVVTTLDTAASMHAILETSRDEDAASGPATSGMPTCSCEKSPMGTCEPARQGCEAPNTSPRAACHSPAGRLICPPDPCKSQFLDGDPEMTCAAGRGLYDMVSTLSAEARLSSNPAKAMAAPAQNSREVSPESAFGMTPGTPSLVQGSPTSLISDFRGGGPPSSAERVENKYCIMFTCKPIQNGRVCHSEGPAQPPASQRSADPMAGTAQQAGPAETVTEEPLGHAEAAVCAAAAPSGAAAVMCARRGACDYDSTVLIKAADEGAGGGEAIATAADDEDDAGSIPATASQAATAAAAASTADETSVCELRSGARGGGGGGGTAAAVPSRADGDGEGEPAAPGAVQPRKGLPTLVPSLLALLSDFPELHCLAPPGTLGGIWLGDWRGMRVAVKLTCCGEGERGQHSSALRHVACTSGLQHPNLLNVYDVRLAKADEASLSELDPPPLLRPGWAAGRRPTGRLQRFLVAHAELMPPEPTYRGDASLTLYPGDLIPRCPAQLTPGQQVLLAVRPRLGDSVVATVMEYCEMGNLMTLACGDQSPFRASRFWAAHVAQGALLRTAREVTAGVAALHAAGLTHGALRPSNVLLSASVADRRGFVARVADVGSGSLIYAASNPLASGPCMVLLAPEALSDEAAEASRAADVYAFGMLLFVMAAGEMPFQGQHLFSVLMAVASEGLRPEWPAEDHPHLEPLFRRCVAQLPQERPSFKQILSEICALERRLKRERRGGAATGRAGRGAAPAPSAAACRGGDTPGQDGGTASHNAA
ncbi:hypothetical protein PLESTB_001078400 [Pleodorina starrii]|uniref:Protein kinase domain-containing protein n=1 Tax=Pleodorina starrii TaxID=330485 RepID=A0A9W6BQE9_9CHLO|nr:hypothetical protein PLESTM_001180700 [Pleodorina starrii]GLC56193.1 hypothetical protein PLESTB_001078400 [Pleodorina starrii]